MSENFLGKYTELLHGIAGFSRMMIPYSTPDGRREAGSRIDNRRAFYTTRDYEGRNLRPTNSVEFTQEDVDKLAKRIWEQRHNFITAMYKSSGGATPWKNPKYQKMALEVLQQWAYRRSTAFNEGEVYRLEKVEDERDDVEEEKKIVARITKISKKDKLIYQDTAKRHNLWVAQRIQRKMKESKILFWRRYSDEDIRTVLRREQLPEARELEDRTVFLPRIRIQDRTFEVVPSVITDRVSDKLYGAPKTMSVWRRNMHRDLSYKSDPHCRMDKVRELIAEELEAQAPWKDDWKEFLGRKSLICLPSFVRPVDQVDPDKLEEEKTAILDAIRFLTTEMRSQLTHLKETLGDTHPKVHQLNHWLATLEKVSLQLHRPYSPSFPYRFYWAIQELAVLVHEAESVELDDRLGFLIHPFQESYARFYPIVESIRLEAPRGDYQTYYLSSSISSFMFDISLQLRTLLSQKNQVAAIDRADFEKNVKEFQSLWEELLELVYDLNGRGYASSEDMERFYGKFREFFEKGEPPRIYRMSELFENFKPHLKTILGEKKAKAFEVKIMMSEMALYEGYVVLKKRQEQLDTLNRIDQELKSLSKRSRVVDDPALFDKLQREFTLENLQAYRASLR